MLVSDDWDVLTLAADTINYNLEAFSVLHPLNDFVQCIYLKVSFSIESDILRYIDI